MRNYAVRIIMFAACVLVPTAHGQVLLWNKTGVPVSTAIGIQRSPALTTDGADGAIIAWEDVGAGATRIMAQRVDADGVRRWDSAGVVIAGESGGKALGDIVSDGRGGAIVCWWDRRNGNDYDLFVQHITALGRTSWTSTGVPVCNATGDQITANMISDGRGGVIVCWEDKRQTGNADIYVQRIDTSGTALWQANGRALCNAPADQTLPQITADGSGGAIVAWTDKRADEDIYAMRVTASGLLSWQTNGVPVCVLAGRQTRPRIVMVGAGASIVVWEDYRNGATSDVYFQKLDPTGTPSRTTNGEPLSRARNDQTNLALAADGLGGAIAAWTDFRPGTTADIYARRIDGSGNAIWKVSGADSTNGLAVTTATDMQEVPAIIADGIGGAFFAWQDKRSVTDIDVYMQSMYPNTTARYPASGGPVIRMEKNQIALQAIPSAVGSVILAWQDGRVADGAADIYAQRIGISAFAPDSVGFDSVTYGASREQRIALRNLGPDTAWVTALAFTSSGSDFIFSDIPGLPFFVRPFDSLHLGVKFVPRDRGYRANAVRVTYGAGSAHLVGVSGIGLIPNLGSYPTSVAFGTRKVGVPVDTLLRGVLKNNGYGDLVIHTMRFDGLNADAFSIVNAPPLPIELNTNDSIPITLRYTPRFNGSESATLTLLSNGSTAVRAISCSGTGVFPTSVITPAFLRFDSSKGAPQTKTVNVKATGTVPLRILAAEIQGTDWKDFSVTIATPVTIQRNDSVFVPVTFTPRTNGLRQAYLRLTLDQFTPVVSIPIYGTGFGMTTAIENTAAPDVLHIGSIYPHPLLSGGTDGMLPIHLAASSPAGSALITVLDALGRTVRSEHVFLSPGATHLYALQSVSLSPGAHLVTVDLMIADHPRLYTRMFLVR